PLKPVPLTGEEVHSSNGDFRVRNIKTEHGNYIFEMKVRNKDSDWKWGYAFDALESIGEIGELNEVQDIIVNHPQSPFNKKPLITRLTHDGNVTATEQSFTEWKDGKMTKREMNRKEFEKLIQNYFGFKKV
ncbi:arylamine N-acetyltransferase, partial [Priestia filamentosa]